MLQTLKTKGVYLDKYEALSILKHEYEVSMSDLIIVFEFYSDWVGENK